jgi:hypothetical protein
MLDTVILNIPRERVRDLANNNGGRPWDLQARTSSYEKHTKNPLRGVKDGVYRPRLTGIKRSVGQGLKVSFVKIEFSVPKLLLGNNLEEVSEKDFPQVIELLQDRLLEAGCIVQKKDLINATVTAFHPSKNIVLSDGYTASLVGRELSKINLNKKFDLDKTSFRNDGQSLQGHTIAHSVVFYDKIADLKKSKRKAIDKSQEHPQLSLFSEVKNANPGLEVLRMEIRLSQKQKLNSVLKKLGFSKDPTFQDIFKKDVCQKIVQFYWETLIKGENLFLFELSSGPKPVLKSILKKYPKLKAKEAIYLVGLNLLCKDDGGIRDLRQVLEGRLNQRSWYRITDSIKKLNKRTTKKMVHGWIKQIEDTIAKFKPLRNDTGPPKQRELALLTKK